MSPRLAGNGLAQRCAMWHEALAGLGTVTSVVAPSVGPAAPDGDEVVLQPSHDVSRSIPRLAQGLTIDRNRALADRLTDPDLDVDLVVSVRSYVGLLGIGLGGATGARRIVELDDDDASFVRSLGDHAEAVQCDHLVDTVSARADLVVSTQGFGGTRAGPNSVRVPEGDREIAAMRAAGSAPAPDPAPPCMVTVGNMGIESFLPLVRERVPDTQLILVGPGSEAFVPYGRGYVAELGPLLASAGAAVVPILHGSGTRIKILDAWAHGLAVVSTTVGPDGLGAVDGVHLVLADDATSFASAIVRTLEDTTLAAELGSAGRALVTARFSRQRVIADVQDMLRSMMSNTRARPTDIYRLLVPRRRKIGRRLRVVECASCIF